MNAAHAWKKSSDAKKPYGEWFTAESVAISAMNPKLLEGKPGTGIIVNGLMARIGMTGLQMETYLSNLLAHALVAFGGYFLLGGWKLFTEHSAATVAPEADPADRKIQRLA